MKDDFVIDTILFIVVILITILLFNKKYMKQHFTVDVSLINQEKWQTIVNDQDKMDIIIKFLDSINTNNNLPIQNTNFSNGQLNVILDFFDRLRINNFNKEFYIQN